MVEGNPQCRPALAKIGLPFDIAYCGDCRREVTMFLREGPHSGNSYYREQTPAFADAIIRREAVELVPIGELLAGARFDLCKLDVQGAELDVLRGGEEMFRHTTHIVMEVAYAEYNAGAPQSEEVFAYMESIGFRKRRAIGDIRNFATGQIVQRDVIFWR